LSRIRKQLGADTLITDGSTVRLNFDRVWVDVAAFQAALGGADMAAQPIEQIETAVSLYRADLLDDLTLNDAPEFELWLLGRRAQMRHLRERGLMALIQRQIDCGQFDAALLTAQQLVQHNPLLEDAHAQLIRLYARTGQRRAALQQYAQCRTLLQQELAIEPGEALQTLAASLEAERPFPPHITPQTAVSFPLSPTASDFVGRTAELTALQTAWQQAQAGQGGVIMIAAQAGGGKTRLVQ
ncbi:MAG: hypothetical protein KC419_15440, partial [Anaerolineales bacterium]|nr:hypothetical protein [Anaerolineales bacterium]